MFILFQVLNLFFLMVLVVVNDNNPGLQCSDFKTTYNSFIFTYMHRRD